MDCPGTTQSLQPGMGRELGAQVGKSRRAGIPFLKVDLDLVRVGALGKDLMWPRFSKMKDGQARATIVQAGCQAQGWQVLAMDSLRR